MPHRRRGAAPLRPRSDAASSSSSPGRALRPARAHPDRPLAVRVGGTRTDVDVDAGIEIEQRLDHAACCATITDLDVTRQRAPARRRCDAPLAELDLGDTGGTNDRENVPGNGARRSTCRRHHDESEAAIREKESATLATTGRAAARVAGRKGGDTTIVGGGLLPGPILGPPCFRPGSRCGSSRRLDAVSRPDSSGLLVRPALSSTELRWPF